MDWSGAIEKNSIALKHVVATLVAMADMGAPSLLPLWEKVSPSGERSELEEQRRMRGVGKIADASDPSSTPHPTSPSLHSGSATFSHKGRREGERPTLPRRLHRAILRLLRPAEAAVRRLIVIAARGLVVPPSPPPRPKKPKPPSIFVRDGVGTGIVLPGTVYFSAERQRLFGSGAGGKVNCPLRLSLPLFDPLSRRLRRRYRTPVCEPRISYADPHATLSPVKLRHPPEPNDRLDATRLTLRIQALSAALDDLPRQVKRLARWRANRDAGRNRGQFTFFPQKGAEAPRLAQAEKSKLSPALPPALPLRIRRTSPLRPGRPPGFNRRLDADMREMLADLHGLAHDVLEHPDTS